MCRYSVPKGSRYKTHYACVTCRYTAKEERYATLPCPHCRAPMVDAGRDFKAPRRGNVGQWRKVAVLLDADIRFDSCGCRGPGPRPRTLADARTQLGHRRSRHQTGSRRDGP